MDFSCLLKILTHRHKCETFLMKIFEYFCLVLFILLNIAFITLLLRRQELKHSKISFIIFYLLCLTFTVITVIGITSIERRIDGYPGDPFPIIILTHLVPLLLGPAFRRAGTSNHNFSFSDLTEILSTSVMLREKSSNPPSNLSEDNPAERQSVRAPNEDNLSSSSSSSEITEEAYRLLRPNQYTSEEWEDITAR